MRALFFISYEWKKKRVACKKLLYLSIIVRIDSSIRISARKERTNSFFIGLTLNKGPISINEEWAVISGWKGNKKFRGQQFSSSYIPRVYWPRAGDQVVRYVATYKRCIGLVFIGREKLAHNIYDDADVEEYEPSECHLIKKNYSSQVLLTLMAGVIGLSV